MKIYTKKGDKGDTSLLYGDQVSKDNSAAERYKNIIILLSIFEEIKLNKLDELSYKPENTSIEIPIDK